MPLGHFDTLGAAERNWFGSARPPTYGASPRRDRTSKVFRFEVVVQISRRTTSRRSRLLEGKHRHAAIGLCSGTAGIDDVIAI